MLGIGVTTRNRSQVLEWCLKHFLAFPPSTVYEMVIVDDCSDSGHREANELCVSKAQFTYIFNHKRKGIAGSKNVCLRALKHCEHVFLFDDDCYPQLSKWDTLFINLSNEYNIGHSSFLIFLGKTHNKLLSSKLPEHTLIDQKIEFKSGYNVFNGGQGMCLFFTRKCLDAVQEYDENFGIYGYEHSDISNRARSAGFCGNEETPYITPLDVEKYLYSLDFDHGWFSKQTSLGKVDFVFSSSIQPDEPIKEYLKISSKNYNNKTF